MTATPDLDLPSPLLSTLSSPSPLGRIRAVTLGCPSLATAEAVYVAALGYRVVERGALPAALAAAWQAPAVAGAPYAVLAPQSGEETYLRFVEVPGVAPFAPYSAYGWNAIELTVEDCDAAVARLAEGPFTVVGPPEDLAFSEGALRAGQLVGPLGEIIYLTQVRRQMPGFELPPARSFVDRVFIMVLHGSAAQPGLDHYAAAFGNPASATFDVTVPFMAVYQGLPPDHPYRIGTLVLGAGFYLEMDNSPAHIGPRVAPAGGLPPGIAMVSFEVAEPQAGGVAAEGAIYAGRTARRVAGAFGEWLELLAPVV